MQMQSKDIHQVSLHFKLYNLTFTHSHYILGQWQPTPDLICNLFCEWLHFASEIM